MSEVQRIIRQTPTTPEEIEYNRGTIGRVMREYPPARPTESDLRNVLWYALFDAAAPTIGAGLSREALTQAVDRQLAALLAPDLARWLHMAAVASSEEIATAALVPPAWPPAKESPAAPALRAEAAAARSERASRATEGTTP